jgi:hypothetical protein
VSLKGLLPVASYSANIAETMLNRASVTLNNLSNMTNFQKRDFIEQFVKSKNYNLTDMIVLQHAESANWTTDNFLDVQALNYTDSWEEGVIPMQLTYLTSHEAFNGVYGIRMEGAPGANTEDTLPVANNTSTAVITNGQSTAGQGRLLRLLQGTANPNTGFFKSLNLPPTWKTNLPIKTMSMVLSTIVKFIVNIIQVFLMFVRPFSTKFRNRWTLWFASSLQQLQLWLGMGGVTGNYGGVIDDIQVG